MNGESTTQAYVAIDVAEERIEPSEESEVVNRLDRGQYVRVFEEANGWSRVTWYYDHFFDGREFARWIKSSSLSPDKPPPAEHGLPQTRLGAALAHSDDAGDYWKRFLQAAQRAIERGLASEDDFVEWGGWITSPSSRGYYFIHISRLPRPSASRAIAQSIAQIMTHGHLNAQHKLRDKSYRATIAQTAQLYGIQCSRTGSATSKRSSVVIPTASA